LREFRLVYNNAGAVTATMPLVSTSVQALQQPIAALHHAYRTRRLTPSSCVRNLLERIRTAGRAEIWTLLVPEDELLERALQLDRMLDVQGPAVLAAHPLFGVPFAVKDNIDIAGLPTTAACPEFAYVSRKTATCVERLLAGYALLIGKTNLDQFATGLVGTRSPYGTVRNAFDLDYISGGSSSGSAVAVALGLASFALGTDTAGSGRVPAGMNGVVGLKPSRGLVSTAGMVPACRSLDCVSVFAANVADAWQVLQAIAGPDKQDPYCHARAMAAPRVRSFRVGIPASCEFFGDEHAADAFRHACEALETIPGVALETVDISPLLSAAGLLYEGPWVAERLAAIGAFFATSAAAIDPAVREAISAGARYSAVDVFRAEYLMAGYRQATQHLFSSLDALMVPTTPTHPRIAEVRSDPATANSRLGHYTNFVNLLDLAAIAVPAAVRADSLPSGVTLIGPAGSDHRLAVIAAKLAAHWGFEVADSEHRIAADPLPFHEPAIELAVVGAHLSGQPLNWQLLECSARRILCTRTAPKYRLYALAGTIPPKPGLVRVSGGGEAIEIEVWKMPQRRFGDFMAMVPPPLAIGSLELADGRWVKGFLCEPVAVEGATDITVHGGWRAYLAHAAGLSRHSAVPEARTHQ
jgi:allophanate hydrolase